MLDRQPHGTRSHADRCVPPTFSNQTAQNRQGAPVQRTIEMIALVPHADSNFAKRDAIGSKGMVFIRISGVVKGDDDGGGSVVESNGADYVSGKVQLWLAIGTLVKHTDFVDTIIVASIVVGGVAEVVGRGIVEVAFVINLIIMVGYFTTKD